MRTDVADMLLNPGFYLVGDTNAPTAHIPMVVFADGTIHSMKIDDVLNPERFLPTAMVQGPYLLRYQSDFPARSDAQVSRDLWTMAAMEKWGGSFVKALGAAARCADWVNLPLLKKTWPDYWAQYEARGWELEKSASEVGDSH